MSNSTDVIAALAREKNPAKAVVLKRFFKTGPGQYGEGDQFWGIVVPKQREIVQQFWKDISLAETQKLTENPVHEIRLTGLLILVKQYEKAVPAVKQQIYNLYLSETSYINNWDLVDLTAPNIVGRQLLDKDRSILYDLVYSQNLWERRIAVLATQYFIKNGEYSDCLRLCEILLNDKHDLIHKATGWMLREIYKKDPAAALDFINRHAPVMPRTMLRYAIEKMPKAEQQNYLAIKKLK